ncbi:MAG: hypothetical protein KC620_07275 [Myxococcales bacterium]|nr:hypothetical protein [Myxococcales bacterium]
MGWHRIAVGGPARAFAATRSVAVFFGWAAPGSCPPAGSPTWDGCPLAQRDRAGPARCVGSGGDGGFHRLDIGDDVDVGHCLGVALVPLLP